MSTPHGGAGGGAAPTRRDKVRAIFARFDANGDGGLDRTEMAALVAAVNPGVRFTPAQISAILDEVFRSYSGFVASPSAGLSLPGLLQTYDDGAGDLDRDFSALSLHPNPNPSGAPRDSTRKIVQDLESLIRTRLSIKNSDSDGRWSADLDSYKKSDKAQNARLRAFLNEWKEMRARIDRAPTTEEAFDGQMAVGKTLYDHGLLSESLNAFRRAAELRPIDARCRFRAGNAFWSMGRPAEAKACYLAALECAAQSEEYSSLLPHIHINLGIVIEGEGLLINAAEHYREAAILCPSHYRALKLLGSALMGVGEYLLAKRALEEAVLLKPDYADAHCELGSVLHLIGGDEERAVLAFQTAINLNSDHFDALYNLGCLFKDIGSHTRAAEMLARVLAIRPDHWRAQLNRAVSLLAAGELKEGKSALNQAFKMTNRVELYNALYNANLQPKQSERVSSWVVVDDSKFKQANKKTTDRKHMCDALWTRDVQKTTKLGCCDVSSLKEEMDKIKIPFPYGEIVTRKAELEIILRKLLHSLLPETFQGAIKAISEKIWAVLDVMGSGKVDLGMFFAVAAPICTGPVEKRKRVAFDALLLRPVKDAAKGQVKKMDALIYMRYLRVIYFPSHGFSDLMEVCGRVEVNEMVSFPEFVEMFDDMDHGFGIMSTLVKLEAGDRTHRGKNYCRACGYRITGLMFTETASKFCLCSSCYGEGKVPSSCEKEEYVFKECGIE